MLAPHKKPEQAQATALNKTQKLEQQLYHHQLQNQSRLKPEHQLHLQSQWKVKPQLSLKVKSKNEAPVPSAASEQSRFKPELTL